MQWSLCALGVVLRFFLTEEVIPVMAILRSGETWKAHPTVAGLYLEQLTFFVFRPIAGEDCKLPDTFRGLVQKVILAPDSLGVEGYGFFMPTGRFKIVGSDSPLLFTD